MTPYERRLLKRIERRLGEQVPFVEGDFFTAWRFLREYYSEEELVRAIKAGNLRALFTEEILAEAFEPVAKQLQEQFTGAIEWEAKELPVKARDRVYFDVANPRHLAAVTQIQTKVITNAKKDVVDVLLAATREGIESATNPRTTARALRSTIGLSDGQAEAVRQFRIELETGDRKALQRALGRGIIMQPDGTTTIREKHAGGFGLNAKELEELKRDLGKKPIDPKKIEKWSEQYRKRQEAFHAETLATTSTLDALKHGQHEATETAIEKGFYDRSRMVSRWVTTLDGRERQLHHDQNGEVVPFGTRFRTGELIPGESTYKCRCIKTDYQLTAKQMAQFLAGRSSTARTLALT